MVKQDPDRTEGRVEVKSKEEAGSGSSHVKQMVEPGQLTYSRWGRQRRTYVPVRRLSDDERARVKRCITSAKRIVNRLKPGINL